MSSPAERYAAAAARNRRERSELARFTASLEFPLDDFQVRACEAVELGKGVLVAAPTGAGKTMVGEFAVHLALATGRKAFYTTPIKALSNQKYHDLVRVHGAANVGLLTGDSSVNGEAPIVVMTTEVLRNMMYAGSRTLDGLGFVVMDEVHYLADRFRGAVWEEVIIHLPEHVQVVSLSATVSNAEEFGDWLAEVRGNHEVVVSEHRPVPLYQHVLVGTTMFDLFAGNRVNPDLLTAIRSAEERGRWQDEPRRGGGGRGGSRGGGRGPGGGSGGRGFARGARPGGGASRAEVIDRARPDGLLPAITFIFSRVGCEAAVGSCSPREPAWCPSARVAADPAPRRGARGLPGHGGPHGARLLGTSSTACRGVSPPTTPGCCRCSGRSSRSCSRPGASGGVRHRDPCPRHQHAGAHGGAGEARQVQRRGPRRHHSCRVHPAHRAGRAPWHRRRGPRGGAVGPGLDPLAVGGLASTRTYPCARASARPTTWPSTSCPRWVGGGPRDPRDLVRAVPGRPGRGRHRHEGAPQRGGAARLRRGDALPPRRLPGVRGPAPQPRRRREGRGAARDRRPVAPRPPCRWRP
jgi:hypothetical protein